MFTIRVKNFLLPINNLELCTWWFSFLSIPYELQHCHTSITISINCQYLIGKVKNNFTTILLQYWYWLFMGFFPWTQFYSNMLKVYEASWNIYWFTLKSLSFLVHLKNFLNKNVPHTSTCRIDLHMPCQYTCMYKQQNSFQQYNLWHVYEKQPSHFSKKKKKVCCSLYQIILGTNYTKLGKITP